MLNVRSLHNKVDSVISLCRVKSLDVVCLVETWHDSDSVCVSRLRASGYQVVERSRPRSDEVTLSTTMVVSLLLLPEVSN
jgi:exonuclease III